MAEATGIAELSKAPKETLEMEFENFRVLSWFSNSETQRPSRLSKPLNWQSAREQIVQIDWRKSLRTALWQREEFEKNRVNRPRLSEAERDAHWLTLIQQFYDVFNAPDTKVSSGGTLMGNPNVRFGKPDLEGNVFRLYINPKNDPESYKKTFTIINKIFKEKGVVGQMKEHLDDVFDKLPDGKFVAGTSGNRLVMYLDAKDGQNITNLLQGLANNTDIFNYLEDSGEWAETGRIPLAIGMSFVEGTKRSWDGTDSLNVGMVEHMRGKPLIQAIKEVRSWPENIDLVQRGKNLFTKNPNRNPRMPGLLATSPLSTP